MRIPPRSVVADIFAARIDPINAFGILQRFLNMSERPAAAPMHAAIKSLTPDEELALATYLRSK
jgi:hypothetical protein